MDRKGKILKQADTQWCNNGSTQCPKIKCVYEGWDGERWRCDHCGETFYLCYDDMK